jgi:ABC-type lipoprotein release transport system permease subunit
MVAAWLWSAANWRRAWRFLIALAALAGVVGGVAIATVAGARRASTAVDRMAETTGWPDVFVFTPSDVPAAVRDELATDPRVQEATDVKVVIGGPPGFGPGGGSLVAVPAGSRFAPVVIEGRLPAPGRADEIAITESALRSGVRVGDQIPLNGVGTGSAVACLGGSGACPFTPMGDVTVTGVVRGLPDLADNTEGGLGVYADAALADAHPEVAQSNVVMVYTDSRADALALTEDLSPLLTDGDVTDGRGDAAGAIQATSVEHNSLLVAGLLLAITGAALVAPGYSRHLARWRSDPVVLSGLGMTRWHRWTGGTLPAVGVALLSVPIAVALASLGSLVLPLGVARRAEVGRSIRIDVPVTVVGCLVTAVVVVAVAAAIAWRWSRAAPRATPRRVGAVTRAVTALGVPPVAATGARFALDPSQGRDRLPVVPTMAAATAGVTLAVGALVVAASMSGLLSSPARYGAGWHLEVGLPLDGDEGAAVAQRLAGDARVTGAALLRTGEVRVRAGTVELGEIGAVGFQRLRGDVSPAVLAGQPLGALDDVLLGSDTFDRSGVAAGDQVVLEGPDTTQQARVVGRTILPSAGSTFSDIGVVMPLDRFVELGAEELVTDLDVASIAALEVPDEADRAALRQELEAEGLRVAEPTQPSKVSVLRSIGPIAGALAVTTLVLVVATTSFALVTATRKRRGELAVLRTLGLRPAEVRRAVGWQSLVVIVGALALGVPLGIVGGRLVWQAIADANRTVPVVDVPYLLLAAAAVLLVAIARLGAIPPARHAAASPPAEALRSE